jgi:hypothetical protein
MRRLTLAFSMLLGAAGLPACSDGAAGGDDGGGAQGGSASGGDAGSTTGGSSTGGGSGSSTGGSATGGSSTVGSSGAATTGGSSPGGSGGSATGGSSGGGFTKTGVCGQRAEAMVTASTYAGYEEFYMVSQEVVDDGRLDEFICLVRFDVTRVGTAPAGCVDLENVPCEWTNQVEFSNPTVLMDVDGACAKNELMWNAAWREGINGTRASYGYVDMYQGHDSVVMKAAGTPGSETWAVYGRGAWDPMTGDFSFDNRLGACQY